MNNIIEYKGYVGEVSIDPEINTLVGRVINTQDVITFYGKTVAELKKEMKVSLDTHLAFCKQQGINPSKVYSGRLNLRSTPNIHAELALQASKVGKSLNQWAISVLVNAAKG